MCTLGGLPVLLALTGGKADERETLRDMLDTAPDDLAVHPGQTTIGDKNYFGREFEYGLAQRHLKFLRPARKAEAEPAGSHLFKPLRQVIESINQTFKAQDVRAAHEHGIVDAVAQASTNCWAYKGYQGAGGTVRLPYRGRWDSLSASQQARSHAKVRAQVEQAIAPLKSWRLLRKLSCSTTRITSLVHAVLALHLASSD